MLKLDPPDWTMKAKCRGTGDQLFGEALEQKRVKAICMGCPVRLRCLSEALDNEIEYGVWGGMTERERRKLLRKRPNVASWEKELNPKESHAA